MATLIFDIETIGEDWGELDEMRQEVLTRWIKRDAESEEGYKALLTDVKEGLGFSPLTGQIVAIGVLDGDKDKGAVYFQSPADTKGMFEDGGYKYDPLPEKEMLQKFWDIVGKYDTFVTFNGRGFDVPFLMVRSAIHGIRPSKNLMANRYLNYQPGNARHIDLLDQLAFYGAVRRKGSLHLWARAFGIESPKSQGVSGDDVATLFKEKRFEDIARYNARDLKATLALYRKYEEFLAF